jgi:uncharacterized protein (TIGR02453 family)
METARETAVFAPTLFDFLRELRENNEREWFMANKARFERDVRRPMLRLVSIMAERLPEVSPHFEADSRPAGGSMFRIHRDTRFSRDKSPYKTHVAAHFRHEGPRDVHGPGFYLHLEPGRCFGGGGIWHPDTPSLGRIRDRLVERPAEWKSVLDTGIHLEGDSLKRPPNGYPSDHPHLADLKRKDFITMSEFSDAEVCAADFPDHFLDACRQAGPLVRFVSKALGLAY